MIWQGSWGHLGQGIARGEPMAFVTLLFLVSGLVVLYKLISWWRLE